MDSVILTPSRNELHRSDDLVVRVQFPLRQNGGRPPKGQLPSYDDQVYVEMPIASSLPYGLEHVWGFRLQSPNELAVFIPMRPNCSAKPDIAVGMISPCHTVLTELEVVGGRAIALINLDEEVDLDSEEGVITLYAERMQGKTWLQARSLSYYLIYLIVSLMVGKKVLREFLKALREGHWVAAAVETLLGEAPNRSGALLGASDRYEACPVCGFKVPASDPWGQLAHLELAHPGYPG